MPVDVNVTPARLQKIRWTREGEPPEAAGPPMSVQFNPNTLALSHSNQNSANGSDDTPSQRMQRAGSKLTLDLLFDVNAPQPDGQNATDVRRLTAPILEVLKAGRPGGGGASNTPMPGLRFEWNAFRFDGMVDSINETMDFFSHEGAPLRCQLSIAMTERKTVEEESTAGDGPGAPGTAPRTPAPSGAPLQNLMGGSGDAWKAAATLNGIENPRLMQAGALLDLNVNVGAALRSAATAAAGAVSGAASISGANLQVDARGKLRFP